MKHALISGKNLFPDNNDLLCCVFDANDFEAILKLSGFQQANIYKALDWVATKNWFVAQLEMLAKKAVEGDKVVIFFSGHGTQQYTFSKTTEGICFTNDSNAWDVLWDYEFKQLLAKFKKGVMIEVYADVCYAGGVTKTTFIEDSRRLKSVPFSETMNLPAMAGSKSIVKGQRKSILLHAAVDKKHTALDGVLVDGKGNGFFSEKLFKVLNSGFRGNHLQLYRAYRETMIPMQIPYFDGNPNQNPAHFEGMPLG